MREREREREADMLDISLSIRINVLVELCSQSLPSGILDWTGHTDRWRDTRENEGRRTGKDGLFKWGRKNDNDIQMLFSSWVNSLIFLLF